MSRRALLLAVLALALAACGREAPPAKVARVVLTTVVGAASSPPARAYAGEVRSRVEQTLGFRVAGKIATRQVDAGSVVKPGQVLATLDPTDTALAASAAEAQRQLAAADVARFRELQSRNFVSQAALDSRETSLAAATAQASMARNQAAYSTLHADQHGVVGQVLAEVGQVVSAGQPVFRVARQDALEVAFAVPESDLAALRAARDAEISLWADETRRYRGRLREIAAMADPQTRTYAARVSILHADSLVVFGMSATVRFASAIRAAAFAIPLAALFHKDGRPAVWLVGRDDTLSLREVEVARYTDEAVEIAAGLQAGERIVVAGVHKLAVGERVRVVDAARTTVAEVAKPAMASSVAAR